MTLISHDIIKALLRTEKSSFFEPKAKYLFLVDKTANKILNLSSDVTYLSHLYNASIDKIVLSRIPELWGIQLKSNFLVSPMNNV